MQARSSADGALRSWKGATADWAGVGFPGPGTAQDVALSVRSAPIALPAAQALLPSAIATTEALGVPTVSTGSGAQVLAPAGIATGEAFGAPSITLGAGAQTLAPAGIATAETFGANTVSIFYSGTGAIGESPIGLRAVGEAPDVGSGPPVADWRQTATSWYWDNNGKAVASSISGVSYTARNGHARLVIDTPANFSGQLPVEAITGNPVFQESGSLQFYVDGVFNQTVAYQLTGGKQQITVSLPVGAHRIEIEEGSLDGTSNGCFVTAIKTLLPITLPTPPARRLTICGDSLGQGNLANPRALAWSMLLRHGSRFDGVTLLGKSGDSASNHMVNSGSRAAWVAEVASSLDGTVENVVLVELITNDYLPFLWTPTAFGTAYATAIDALHTQVPSVTINLLSTFTLTEVVNGGGFSAADYNSQVSAIAAARSTYCHYIDGTNYYTGADLGQGGGDSAIHPGAVGNGKVYAALNAIL